MATPGSERLTSLAIAASRSNRQTMEAERAKWEAQVHAYQRQQEKAANAAKKKSGWGTIGSLVGGLGGAALGAFAGGPMGAMAGYSLGGALGGTLSGGMAGGDYTPGPMQEQMFGQIPQSLMMYYLYGQGGASGQSGPVGGPRASVLPGRGGYAPSMNMAPTPSISMLGSGGR